ncbi:hypothetical protein [Catalinimonas niigatensis]|uniref:hypothetical protein n=1 Tax=Catalinimonas niigatensis TaxID=1397264 RepID=UPI002665EEAE|nr:hypothetical protein [Catalinimonas niigatensis]WPP51150.1 hypothetical protein PZB72_01925 [Catalinimonas niigatensis]
MKRCNLILNLALLFSVVFFFSSCESSKIAFGNSYYFKQTPKKISKVQTAIEKPSPETQQKSISAQALDSKDGYASTEVMAAEKSIKEQIEKVEEKIKKMKTLEEEEKKREINNITLTKAEKKAFKKEKKAEQKELKKEIKVLAKEFKKAPEEVKKQQAVSGNTRTGIILGGVGLILLIIGGPVLYTVGAILLVVGLVLILVDVL